MKQDDERYVRYTGEHGFDNRYATLEEAKALLEPFSLSHPEENRHGGGVPFIAEGDKLYLDALDYHTLILGATGSMKTRVFVFPTVYTLGLSGENMLISDPKGEIFKRTSGWLKAQGYDVKVFNLREPAKSDCWNPLYEAARLYQGSLLDKDEAKTLIGDFCSFLGQTIASSRDPYWETSATAFLEAAFQIVMAFEKNPEHISVRSISSFVSQMSQGEDGVSRFARLLPLESLIRDKLLAISDNAETTKRCLLGMLESEIEPFLHSDAISYLTSRNTIDLHAFASSEKKTALFVIVPDEKTTFHFLAAALIKQLYTTAVADASINEGLRLPRRLNFILDEFANMPAIPDMGSMISAARSRNIRFCLVVQNNAQLIKNYGPELAETIKSNCLNWVYLNSKEQALLQQLQEMGGHVNSSPSSPFVIALEELASLKKGPAGAEAIIFLSRSSPFLSRMPDIDSYAFPRFPPVDVHLDLKRPGCFNFTTDVLKRYSDKEIIAHMAAAEGLSSGEEAPEPPKEEPKVSASEEDALGFPSGGEEVDDIDKKLQQWFEEQMGSDADKKKKA